MHIQCVMNSTNDGPGILCCMVAPEGGCSGAS